MKTPAPSSRLPAERAKYDLLGNITSEQNLADPTAEPADHLFGFTGRERDEESDLQYNRARYFDAAIGQWVSEDPLGFDAGDANLRRYVGNRSTFAVDPSGLDWLYELKAVPGFIGFGFNDEQKAVRNSFWTKSGGKKWGEVTGGAAAIWEGDGEMARQQLVSDIADRYTQRIVLHHEANGGDVEQAIKSATGWRMVGADLSGMTEIGETYEAFDYTDLHKLEGDERLQRGGY